MCACLSFVFGVCLFFWVFLCLSCFVLSCAYLFFDCVLLLIFLFVSFAYLSFILVFLLAFLFQICFEGGSFWSHYPSNIYDTTCLLWSHTISSQYVPCNKSLCFEGVLFRHMINMFSWSHYPSNMLEGKTCDRTFYTAHTKFPSSYLAVSSRNWIDNMYTLSLIPNKKSRAKYLSEDDGDSI